MGIHTHEYQSNMNNDNYKMLHIRQQYPNHIEINLWGLGIVSVHNNYALLTGVTVVCLYLCHLYNLQHFKHCGHTTKISNLNTWGNMFQYGNMS